MLKVGSKEFFKRCDSVFLAHQVDYADFDHLDFPQTNLFTFTVLSLARRVLGILVIVAARHQPEPHHRMHHAARSQQRGPLSLEGHQFFDVAVAHPIRMPVPARNARTAVD